jgi:dipeptidase
MTSRQGVEIMGSLASQYGYNDVAESLLIADTSEVFIFHILRSDEAVGAIWVAQRVPDGSIAAVTNAFTIREIDFEDDENFITSPGMRESANNAGWWKEGQSFDFSLVFSDGSGPQYDIGRRMWRIYSLLAPQVVLPEDYDDFIIDNPYPATIIAKNITRDAVFKVMRDFYSGTSYALDAGMAAGYGGSPERWSVGSDAHNVTGSWERSISLYRSQVSLVNQLKDTGDNSLCGLEGIVWFTSGAAHGGTYIPVSISMSSLPESVTNSTSWSLLERWSAAWASRFLLQILQLRFDQGYAAFSLARMTFENSVFAQLSGIEARCVKSNVTLLNEEFGVIAKNAVSWMWSQSDSVLTTVANNPWGYPAWWLESDEVGYTSS